MRDLGLQQAIDAAGGVAALARALGIAQPSVSNWSKIPAERVVAVESLTGVPRASLRPDLYDAARSVDEVDLARGQAYLLLGRLLREAPSQALLDQIAAQPSDASPFGLLRRALADAADETSAGTESREFFRLFIGVGRGELLPYASYYLTGFLHERPLARVREDLANQGIQRAEGLYEPEDHLGILCDVMGGFALGEFAGDETTQRAFFRRHLEPFALKLLADLESCAATPFYRAVARWGAAFIAIEAEAFTLDT